MRLFILLFLASVSMAETIGSFTGNYTMIDSAFNSTTNVRATLRRAVSWASDSGTITIDTSAMDLYGGFTGAQDIGDIGAFPESYYYQECGMWFTAMFAPKIWCPMRWVSRDSLAFAVADTCCEGWSSLQNGDTIAISPFYIVKIPAMPTSGFWLQPTNFDPPIHPHWMQGEGPESVVISNDGDFPNWSTVAEQAELFTWETASPWRSYVKISGMTWATNRISSFTTQPIILFQFSPSVDMDDMFILSRGSQTVTNRVVLKFSATSLSSADVCRIGISNTTFVSDSDFTCLRVAHPCDVTFTNCTFLLSGSTGRLFYTTTDILGTLAFVNCDIYSARQYASATDSSLATDTLVWATVAQSGSIVFSGNTWYNTYRKVVGFDTSAAAAETFVSDAPIPQAILDRLIDLGYETADDGVGYDP